MTESTNFFVDDGDGLVEKSIPIEKAVELYKNNLSNTYPPVFYKNTRKCQVWQTGIGEVVGKMYNVRSAVDFGCGLGYYLMGFRKSGAENVKGFEISYDNVKDYIDKEISQYVSYGNAMEKIDCGKFDLSMSIEVAEHILPEKSEVFVDNLTSASNKYILFTAAPPGQGGLCHINEKDASFWLGLMKSRGFNLSEEDGKKIKESINKIPYKGKYFSVIKKHIMFFRRG